MTPKEKRWECANRLLPTTNYQLPKRGHRETGQSSKNVARGRRFSWEQGGGRQCLCGREAKEPPPMFEDNLIESGGVLKTKRPAATAASLVLQSALVAMLAALPLLYTEALPKVSLISLVAPGPPPPAQAPARAETQRRAAPVRE